MPHLGARSMDSVSYLLALILFDAGCRTGVIGGVIRVSQVKEKNAGLKAATLISVSNPVSQVLW
jgi:hypothetical protein